MDKKTIYLELPCEVIEKIDDKNISGDRSVFITELLKKQLNENFNDLDYTTFCIKEENKSYDNIEKKSGIVKIFTSDDGSIGSYDIDTIEGFESLINKIADISMHPIVKDKVKNIF